MNLLKTIPFVFAGESYEIKIFRAGNLINILVFKNHYPANGFRHQLRIPKSISIKNILENGIMDEYIDICKEDITEKRWERLVKTSKNNI